MARPQDQPLTLAQGKPAPQFFNATSGKFEVLHGADGANYVSDTKVLQSVKEVVSKLDNITGNTSGVKEVSDKASLAKLSAIKTDLESVINSGDNNAVVINNILTTLQSTLSKLDDTFDVSDTLTHSRLDDVKVSVDNINAQLDDVINGMVGVKDVHDAQNLSKLDEMKVLLEGMSDKQEEGSQLHYFKTGESLPTTDVKDGDIAINVNDWGDLHFRYKGKWETRGSAK